MIEKGVALADAMQYEDARSEFEAALLLDPDRFEVLSNLGTLSQLANQHERAIQQYSQALSLSPQHVPSMYSRALSYASLGDFQRAVEDYSLALHLDPSFVRAFMGRGHIFMQQGDWKAALADFDLFLTHSATENLQLIQQVEDWRRVVLNLLDPQSQVQKSFEDIQVETEEAIQTGDLAKAVTLAEQALQLEPNSSSAHNLYSCVMVAYENWPQAKAYIDQAIKLDDQAAILYLNRAGIFHALHQLEETEQDIRTAIRLDPEMAEAHLELGSLLAQGKDPMAMDAFTNALHFDPNLVEARMGRARLYLDKDQPELAILDLAEAQMSTPQHPDVYELIQEGMQVFASQIDKDPSDPMNYVRRAQVYLQLGREEDALADWNYALKLQPENPLLLDGRAMLLIDIEQYHQAILDLEKAMYLVPNQAELYHHRAIALIHLRRTAEAIEDLSQAIQLAPERSGSYYLRGKLRRTLHQMEVAYQDLQKAIDLGGEQVDLYKEYALVLLDRGDLEAAAQAYQRAAEIYPDPDICLDCAYTLNALGQLEAALGYLDLVLESWPDHSEALCERGWLLAQLGQIEEAIADLRQSASLTPHQWEAWLYLAEVHIALEEWEDASLAASRCLLGQTDHLRSIYLRGLSFQKMGNHEASARDWNRILVMAPDSEEAQLIRLHR